MPFRSPVVCRQRYHQDKLRYDKQFEYELKMLELMQNSAYDSMRFHRWVQAYAHANITWTAHWLICTLLWVLEYIFRHFAITTLWPPLHTRKEIEYVISKFFRLPDKQTRRLHDMMIAPVY